MKKKILIALISVLSLTLIIHLSTRETEVKEISAEISAEIPVETPVEEVIAEEKPEGIVEEPVEEIVEEPVVEEEVVIAPIDPDSKTRSGIDTFREIRAIADEFYTALIKNGFSKDDAMVEMEALAKSYMTSMDELNNLEGYSVIGESKPVASTPKPTPTPPKTTTPTNPTTPKPSTPKPSEPEPTQPTVEDNDKNGNGIRDDWEDNYANTDGTVSLPPGTENPFDMP